MPQRQVTEHSRRSINTHRPSMGCGGAARTGVRVRSAHRVVTGNFSSPWVRLCVRLGGGRFSVRVGEIFALECVNEAEFGFSRRENWAAVTDTPIVRLNFLSFCQERQAKSCL